MVYAEALSHTHTALTHTPTPHLTHTHTPITHTHTYLTHTPLSHTHPYLTHTPLSHTHPNLTHTHTPITHTHTQPYHTHTPLPSQTPPKLPPIPPLLLHPQGITLCPAEWVWHAQRPGQPGVHQDLLPTTDFNAPQR